ncbi:MAG: hypothetical protein MZV64_16205 [Ignavibacteriales bacterium]|nr:hypothetical protein [Ignavibacteriales bacterium]
MEMLLMYLRQKITLHYWDKLLIPGMLFIIKPMLSMIILNLQVGLGGGAVEGDVRVIKSNTGEWIDDEDVESIRSGDTIWIPEDPPGPKFWEVFTTSLQILGQVASVIAATVAVIIATR